TTTRAAERRGRRGYRHVPRAGPAVAGLPARRTETTPATLGRSPVDLSLSTHTRGEYTVVEVGGEIDVYTAPRLREQLVQLSEDGYHHLIIDMEAVDFLDSTGLGVLVGGLKRVRTY